MDTFFLHQRCPLISIYLSLSVAHVSNRLRFDLLSYFLFKMVSVVNELPYHKKIVTNLKKIVKWLWYEIITESIIYKQHFTRAQMFHRIVGVLKCILKKVVNLKTLYRIKCEPKCLVYPCRLHLNYKRDSCTQLIFSEFCRIFSVSSLRALLGECFCFWQIKQIHERKVPEISNF